MYSNYLITSLFTIAISTVSGNSTTNVPVNPFTAETGLGTMHGDTVSSDTMAYSGPGAGQTTKIWINLYSICPSIVQANDGFILALCTTVTAREPIVYMLTPSNGTILASLKLVKGGLFGGVYAYVDNLNNLIVADGSKSVLRIAHTKDNDGTWRLKIMNSISVESVLTVSDDYIVGLSPDWYGNIWFASATAVVGYVNLEKEMIQSLNLPSGESVANSISTSPEGTFVTTDHALYMISADVGQSAIPTVNWRYAYERGPGRKPGQLSWGSGSTPTIFGPSNGTEYVTIADNAVPMNILIFETVTGKLLCKHPVFTESGSGSENSPIGLGNSVFITSSYGYPYLALPPNASDSVPTSGKYTGGIVRIEYNATSSTCSTKWTNSSFRNAAVAKLSTSDNLIYTMNRINPFFSDASAGMFDAYYFATIDPDTGNVVSKQFIGIGMFFDSHQLAPLITREGHYYQGVELKRRMYPEPDNLHLVGVTLLPQLSYHTHTSFKLHVHTKTLYQCLETVIWPDDTLAKLNVKLQ